MALIEVIRRASNVDIADLDSWTAVYGNQRLILLLLPALDHDGSQDSIAKSLKEATETSSAKEDMLVLRHLVQQCRDERSSKELLLTLTPSTKVNRVLESF